jgi:polyphosphate glucokinase
MSQSKRKRSKVILMLDIGGTNAKCMCSGQDEVIKIPSGPRFTPRQLVREVKDATKAWRYDAITLGYPGVVINGRPAAEPGNLGKGWVKFNYRKAFGKPVRFINDAAMQALAGYKFGRMLYLGFGTSVGSALIVDDVLISLEIGKLCLPSGSAMIEQLEDRHLKSHDRRKWVRRAISAIKMLQAVFHPDDIVLGGGNAKHIKPLPKGCRIRENHTALRGAVRLWPGADMLAESYGTSWRIKKAKPARKREPR